MNILIVDDQPTNLKLLRAQLQAGGYHVTPACNGVEALAVLEREKVDAIISDILMPKMDGYRLCYEVRKNPRLQTIPFVFYTATYTSRNDEKLCLDLGGDKYLRKPSPFEEIAATLREVTSDARRHAPNRAKLISEPEVMKEYSERLVSKLEEKHTELEQAMAALQAAHSEILELNRSLEQRVGERTAELEAANKELEAFSYSVSHDLRAPLRAINGFLRVFQEDYGTDLSTGARETLDLVCDSATDMGRLIDGLLTFSQLSRQPLHKQDVSAKTMARRVIDELRGEADAQKADFSIADLPDCRADPMLLQQVFVNLVSNALKYSRYRVPALIEVGYRDEQGLCTYFVRDNGAGFDMQYAGRLFGVFQRLHSSSQFEGIGIGLSIVQRIIQRHGGHIWAEAQVDQGATFYFTVPG